ncbi:MAG TPA: Gfo/Idh/MocA family oxidoreductase [Dermatophilaceae bacterium]|nr:Gfo/Idh/MocA family oxidoreductase [Dermatophilaceae bacterium]
MRVGLVGYGAAGRHLHRPMLAQAGFTVAAVVTAHPERVAQVRANLPDALVVEDLDALLRVPDLDLVVVASASGAHAAQALAVVDRGLPLVVDKPLAVDAASALEIADAAERAGVPLTVFQNRRFDAEHVAARDTVRSGALGEVFRFEFRWERWRPEPQHRWREDLPAEQGGGVMLDLHTHLVDAAVDLFGPVASVYAHVASRNGVAEDDAVLDCVHESGVVSILSATSLAGAPGPRLRLLGTAGAFLLNRFQDDVDIYPDLVDPAVDHCGFVYRGADRTPVPRPAAGSGDFYDRVRTALESDRAQELMPVQPRQAVHTLAVIDAARRSAGQGQVVHVVTPGQSPD